jgi:hypothetical protein
MQKRFKNEDGDSRLPRNIGTFKHCSCINLKQHHNSMNNNRENNICFEKLKSSVKPVTAPGRKCIVEDSLKARKEWRVKMYGKREQGIIFGHNT